MGIFELLLILAGVFFGIAIERDILGHRTA